MDINFNNEIWINILNRIGHLSKICTVLIILSNPCMYVYIYIYVSYKMSQEHFNHIILSKYIL